MARLSLISFFEAKQQATSLSFNIWICLCMLSELCHLINSIFLCFYIDVLAITFLYFNINSLRTLNKFLHAPERSPRKLLSNDLGFQKNVTLLGFKNLPIVDMETTIEVYFLEFSHFFGGQVNVD